MPLFRRPDGKLVKDLSPVRRIIPYLMKGRNESVVYYEQIVDLSRTLPFIRAWNQTHDHKLTLFHLLIAAAGRQLNARSGLNRFISGGRIYQRNEVLISFAVKQKFEDRAALKTVKMAVPPEEPLEDTVRRCHEAVGEGRSDKERGVDKEVRWILKLPGFLIRFLVWAQRTLDRFNLLPGGMTRQDPMYASLFLANLGSVGIDRAWHHLYEYGTVSLFGVMGAISKTLVVGDDGQPTVRDTVRLRFAFDERINDGFYCAASLDGFRRYLENPELFAAGPLEQAENRRLTQVSSA